MQDKKPHRKKGKEVQKKEPHLKKEEQKKGR
jgi:hypothetical protein